jgi:hypothetical protein
MKNQSEISENKENYRGGVKWYKEKIVEMVGEIEDVWILEQIHKFVINMTEEGD